jgi:Fic family protein
MAGVGFDLAATAELDTLSQEVITSSQIEGEQLDANKVRSSISKQLGLQTPGATLDTHDVDGAVQVALDATKNFKTKLTAKRLYGWHAALFPMGYSGMHKIRVAGWRKDAMQVVSGAIGRQKIHYEAPAPTAVPGLMRDFMRWCDATDNTGPLIKAALAHLWFLTIHPFDDGNGRIARALTEMQLARSDGSPRRFYSMAAQILAKRDSYYDVLEHTQKGTPDITQWMLWFYETLLASLASSETRVNAVLKRVTFWQDIEAVSLNERQRKVLKLLLGDFEGKLTTSKWAKLCKTSQDTALRDINDLVLKGILTQEPQGGRSTAYWLADK